MRDEGGELEGTILGGLAHLGVRINGLVIPGRSIESVLERHAFNLVVNNDHETFKVSLAGSATALRYRGREFLLATRHQLRTHDLSQVAMLSDAGSHIVTSGGARWYESKPDSDAHDIVAFDFTEPCQAHPEFRRRFFDLGDLPSQTLNVDIVGFLLTGYPSDGQAYELEEKNHLGLARLKVICTLEPPPSDPALIRLKVLRGFPNHPDGMSGGSAFAIQTRNDEFQAFFAGIILRGGRSHFYVLKSGFIKAFLDVILGA